MHFGRMKFRALLVLLVFCLFGQRCLWAAGANVSGTVLDDKGQLVVGATVTGSSSSVQVTTRTDERGCFSLALPGERIRLRVSGEYIASEERVLEAAAAREALEIRIHYLIPPVHESLVITATALNQ